MDLFLQCIKVSFMSFVHHYNIRSPVRFPFTITMLVRQ